MATYRRIRRGDLMKYTGDSVKEGKVVFVMSFWEKTSIGLDDKGYFYWYKGRSSKLAGGVKIANIYEDILAGTDCESAPLCPAPPINGKILNMFTCPDDNHTRKWMDAIFSYFPKASDQRGCGYLRMCPNVFHPLPLPQPPLINYQGYNRPPFNGSYPLKYIQQRPSYDRPPQFSQPLGPHNANYLYNNVNHKHNNYSRNTHYADAKRIPLLELRIGSADTAMLNDKGWNLAKKMERKNLDFFCLQEIGWLNDGFNTFNGYKLFWTGGKTDLSKGVGIMLPSKWVNQVKEIKRICDRIIMLKIRMKKYLLNLFSVCAPKVEDFIDEKEEFYRLLLDAIAPIKDHELLIICGNFNGQVGHVAGEYTSIHGGKSYGERTQEGELLLKFAHETNMAIANTYFQKKKTHLATYHMEDCFKVTDYILISAHDRKWLRDVTTINSEEDLNPHVILLTTLSLDMRRRGNEPSEKQKNCTREESDDYSDFYY